MIHNKNQKNFRGQKKRLAFGFKIDLPLPLDYLPTWYDLYLNTIET